MFPKNQLCIYCKHDVFEEANGGNKIQYCVNIYIYI